MQLPRNRKILSQFFFAFLKSASVPSQYKRVFEPTNSNSIISKSKHIFSIFFSISKIYIKFWILLKKRLALEVISFWNYRVEKARLLKFLERSVSEHLWTVNTLSGPKHCLNLHGSIFVGFVYHSEKTSARKVLC